MATVTTSRTATGVPARFQEKGVFSDTATYECAALAANDVIQMVNVAPGVTVLDVVVSFDDLGVGTTIDVGDGADVDRYIDGADTDGAAGAARMSAAAGFPTLYSTADTIDVKILGAAATGTITLTALMTAEATDLA